MIEVHPREQSVNSQLVVADRNIYSRFSCGWFQVRFLTRVTPRATNTQAVFCWCSLEYCGLASLIWNWLFIDLNSKYMTLQYSMNSGSACWCYTERYCRSCGHWLLSSSTDFINTLWIISYFRGMQFCKLLIVAHNGFSVLFRNGYLGAWLREITSILKVFKSLWGSEVSDVTRILK